MSGNNIELIRIHVKELPASVINDGDAIYEKALKEGYDTLRDNGIADYDEAVDDLVINAAEYERGRFYNRMKQVLSDILTQVRGFELGNVIVEPESDIPTMQIRMAAVLLFGTSRENAEDAYRAAKEIEKMNIDWYALSDFIESLKTKTPSDDEVFNSHPVRKNARIVNAPRNASVATNDMLSTLSDDELFNDITSIPPSHNGSLQTNKRLGTSGSNQIHEQ